MNPRSSALYLLDLTVRNVRCFGPEQTLRLHDKQGRPAAWTVILGDNGVGKTTLLQCLVALEPQRHFFRPANGEERPRVELPITGGDWKVYREPGAPWSTEVRGRVAEGEELRSSVWSEDEIEVPMSSRAGGGRVSRLPVFPELRCCAYGATRRLGSGALHTNEEPDDPAASLFSDSVGLVDAEAWLLVEDYARRRGAFGEDSERRLRRVKSVLLGLLPHAHDLRVAEPREVRRSRLPKPIIEVETPYGWVPLADLSLGYRTMIAWTVDLASRLFEFYPDSPNPLAEPAVVLVDEVDLHLHPKWQRALRGHLTERFPNAQFIVTAHSPLVVQASEDENIVLLRREGDHVVIDNDVETVRGWRVDQVLTSDLFGLATARPPEYDSLIEERNEILSKPVLDEQDRAVLSSLEERIVELPAGETHEDLKALDIIRRAAAKLEKSSRVPG